MLNLYVVSRTDHVLSGEFSSIHVLCQTRFEAGRAHPLSLDHPLYDDPWDRKLWSLKEGKAVWGSYWSLLIRQLNASDWLGLPDLSEPDSRQIVRALKML